MSQATAENKLYQIADQYTVLANRYMAIMELVEEAEGELSIDQDKELTSLTEQIEKIIDGAEEKVLNIARLITEQDLRIAALKGEEDRIAQITKNLAAKRKRLERSNEFFKGYILSNLDRMNLDKVQDQFTTVSIRKSESVDVNDTTILPSKYLRRATVEMSAIDEGQRSSLLVILEGCSVPYTVEADKNEIKKAIKSGVNVPGAEIKPGRSLIIR